MRYVGLDYEHKTAYSVITHCRYFEE